MQRVGAIALASGRACALGGLAWSDEGQVLVATSDAVHILTPSAGSDVHAEPPPARDAHRQVSLPAPSTSRATARDETLNEGTQPPSHTDEPAAGTLLGALGQDAWYAAAWSPSGAGPRHRYVRLRLTAAACLLRSTRGARCGSMQVRATHA